MELWEILKRVTTLSMYPGMSRLVKLDGETSVRVTDPAEFDFVQLTQGGNEMVSTRLGGVLDTKVVNDKCKDSAIGGVPEKAWGGCLYVPVRCEMRDEALLRIVKMRFVVRRGQ